MDERIGRGGTPNAWPAEHPPAARRGSPPPPLPPRGAAALIAGMSPLAVLTAVRYVQPLREGGSLPAVVETEDGGLHVVKFRGAGQGAKALVAELVAGLIARTLGLPVPDLAIVDVTAPFGRGERDPEIQDLLRKSEGLNVGIRYLDGAFNFEGAAAGDLVTPELAARIIWLDAYLTNPDRTHRNPNLLIWNRQPWLIDHGAALYAHHDWRSVDDARTRTPFPLIRDHVLLAGAGDIAAADAALAPRLDEAVLDALLAQVPDSLIAAPSPGEPASSADAMRARYREYLEARLRGPRPFVDEAVRAMAAARSEPRRRLEARR